MYQCLKPALFIADGHECLAVDDGRARLDAVIFSQVDFVDVYFLLLSWQLLAIPVLRDRSDDGAVCLFPCRPR